MNGSANAPTEEYAIEDEEKPALNPFTTLLLYALDVRTMILVSLLLQFTLFVLGKRRKHSVSLINKIILWIACQSKDWVAIAALGKLTNPLKIDDNPYVLGVGSLWAPLLILHLGGPDTITAYSFQDTQLWTRHLLTLIVQSSLAFCVMYLSLPKYWTVYLFTIPLCFAGISQYIERILCLKATNSMKTEQIISIFKNPNHLSHPLLDHQESKIVLLGYALFSAMRPDFNNYLSQKEHPLSFKVRIRTYVRDHEVMSIQEALLEGDEKSSNPLSLFDIAVVELGFIFDVIYTKAAFIYTRKGFILRLTSFTLSIGILVYFLILIYETRYTDFDEGIILSLVIGAVALDICAVLSILCSDWAVILMHNNCLARKILQYVFQYFRCFLPQQKRWSVRMGQFDLLNYCWNFRKGRVYRFLPKCCNYDILEHWHRFKYASFVEVPSWLRPKDVYHRRLDSFFSGDSFEATRGDKTLDELRERISVISDLEWSIKVDFDASIIAWHLATTICYHEDTETFNDAPNEAMKISKYLSDYMMYLLVIRPAMLLPDDRRSFWLDRALDELWDTVSKASNKKAIFDSLSLDLPEFSPQTAMENLPKYAGYLATKLKQITNKWELIKAMWIEMLLYAAHSYPHVNHVRQLGQYGREFLSIIWVMGGYRVIEEVIKDQQLVNLSGKELGSP